MNPHDEHIGTHWEGCEEHHHACALARLGEARRALFVVAELLMPLGKYGMTAEEVRTGCVTSIEQLRTLLDEEQRDANRYKWLRDVWWLGDYFDTPDPMAHATTAEEFDAAIDEARILRAGEGVKG